MATSKVSARKREIIVSYIPWLIVVVGLISYFVTINHWVTLNNITQTWRSIGKMEAPDLGSPLYLLLTYPFHWLPAQLVPITLNVFSAVCGALTLGLLARSVGLLPHDRTHDQRMREDGAYGILSTGSAWVPSVLAALVFGLQLTVWESATTGAKEMLDLLLFAYVIRCILEFRISDRESWLYRAAFVYAIGMTGNWIFIGLLPLFFLSLIWIQGGHFFNPRFLLILLLCGAAGLLFYLLPPLVYSHSGLPDATFWQGLKVNLKEQKTILWQVHYWPFNNFLMLALTSLIPILLISIRWASHFGDPSPMGTALTTIAFHLSHGLLLGACLWAAFDPAFGLRQNTFHLTGLTLILSYLSALAVGYLSGYFLLVFVPLRTPSRRIDPNHLLLHRIAQSVTYLILLLVPPLLIVKNLPAFAQANRDAIKTFAQQLIGPIPPNAVVLSDDPFKLFLAQNYPDSSPQKSDRIFLDTQKLGRSDYFNEQQKLHPKDWPPALDIKGPPQGINPMYLLQLIYTLSTNRPVYYLHPSFGYYFEIFYPEPHGLVYQLKVYPTNSLTPPPLTKSQVAENEKFWTTNTDMLTALDVTASPETREVDRRRMLLKKLHVPHDPSIQSIVLGEFYSLALNYWGVYEQSQGQLEDAGKHFKLAGELIDSTRLPNGIKFDSLPAKRNAEFNKDLVDGVKPTILRANTEKRALAEEDFGTDPGGQVSLRKYGPFDEPTHRVMQAMLFSQGSLFRQAAVQFKRAYDLVPDSLTTRFGLASFYIRFGFSQKALEMIPEIKAQFESSAEPEVSKYDLLRLETSALFAANRTQDADRLLRQSIDDHPKDINFMQVVCQIAGTFRSYTNAMIALDHAIAISPENAALYVDKGVIAMQTGDYALAISSLTKALNLETNNASAKFDRALSYLNSGKLDEARQDYEDLAKAVPNTYQIYYGLGEIAWRKHDTNAAKQYYELYLVNAPPGTDEAKSVSERYESLVSPSQSQNATNAPQTGVPSTNAPDK